MQLRLKRLCALALGAGLTVAGASACNDDDTTSSTTTPSDAGTSGRDTGTDNGQEDSASDAPAAALSESEIAAIGAAINKGEIAQGNLASSKATNTDVKAFGAQMVTEHNATLQRQTALFAKLGVSPRDNDDSRALTAKGDADTATLSAKSGSDFDVSYIDVQVAAHTAALAIFDTKLIPSAVHQELKDDLTTTRAAVKMHLDHAQSIRAALGGDGGVRDASADVGRD